MITLTPSTCRRLQQLPQPTESIWEGDRRPLPIQINDPSNPNRQLEECIIWVDGSEGVVRAMEMVSSQTGPEAIVRVLLKAMESPPTPSKPSQPQKIVVRDREIQFYLRGVLQGLDITIEHRPQLPLIDHLFDQMANEAIPSPPPLPEPYETALLKAAQKIWQAEPWHRLAEHQVIGLELNQWDIERFYVSILGMLGEEYGILLYRSLESLKGFRSAVLAHKHSREILEDAFLHQDCYFVTFDLKEDSSFADFDEPFFPLNQLRWSEIEPNFGVIHPLEGLRSTLAEEEVLAMICALEALQRFFKATRDRLSRQSFESLTYRYRINLPEGRTEQGKSFVWVKAETLPEVATDLQEMMMSAMVDQDEDDDEDDDDEEWEISLPILRTDLIPENALCTLSILPWENWELIRQQVEFYQAAPQQIQIEGEGLPIIMIQTSKPKAKEVIAELLAFDGLEGIGFNLGEDPDRDTTFDLGILRTGDGELYLFDEFERNSEYRKDRKKWDDRCRQTAGYCGLVIATGMRGQSRGNPKPKDMLALFETKFLSIQDLNLGVLQKIPYLL